MTEEPAFFEVSGFVSSIEKLRDRLVDRSEGVDRLLDLALRVSEGKEGLVAAREEVRRSVDLTVEEIGTLAVLARQVGEENHDERYAMLELIQAGAVARVGLVTRSMVSEMLAVAAKQTQRFERARLAYADAMEGLSILSRFFRPDDDAFRAADASVRSGWQEVRSRSGREGELFDGARGDPADELLDLIVWNTDTGGGEGLLAQVDATLRLALRFEHVAEETSESLGALTERIAAGCVAAASGDPFLEARYLITLGDALTEAGQWNLALFPLRAARSPALLAAHPLRAHSLVQEAYCHLMLGEAGACRAGLEVVDVADFERLADLVITVAAELARYHAVDHLCRHVEGRADGIDIQPRVTELMRQVALIASSEGEDSRVRYLRNLFFAVLARDVGSMLATVRRATG